MTAVASTPACDLRPTTCTRGTGSAVLGGDRVPLLAGLSAGGGSFMIASTNCGTGGRDGYPLGCGARDRLGSGDRRDRSLDDRFRAVAAKRGEGVAPARGHVPWCGLRRPRYVRG